MNEVVERVKLVFLVDNRCYNPELISTWGLSIFVETEHCTLLFDVNSEWSIVAHNANKLGININDVNYIVISHWHGDHAGGLCDAIKYFKRIGKHIKIIIPSMRQVGEEVIIGNNPVKLSRGVLTTGSLGFILKEQSLILNLRYYGPLVLVGCAHPGLRNILRRVCSITGRRKIYGVLGGYHIGGYEAKDIAQLLESYGVELIGPAHCTANDAINYLARRFKDKFVKIYTGKKLELVS